MERNVKMMLLVCVKYPRYITTSELFGYLPSKRRKVTLREMKGYFRRGTEKLPLQTNLSGGVHKVANNYQEEICMIPH